MSLPLVQSEGFYAGSITILPTPQYVGTTIVEKCPIPQFTDMFPNRHTVYNTEQEVHNDMPTHPSEPTADVQYVSSNTTDKLSNNTTVNT